MRIVCVRCRRYFPKGTLKSDVRLGGLHDRAFCDKCFLDEIEDQTAICPDCGAFHICPDVHYPPKWGSKLCPACAMKNRARQELILSKHIHTARRKGLPATLTIDEWYETVYHFNLICAYCQIRPYKILEHFLPVELGGGTTKDNCVPACDSCNRIKRRLYPNELLNHPLIPGAIERVQTYLSQFSQN